MLRLIFVNYDWSWNTQRIPYAEKNICVLLCTFGHEDADGKKTGKNGKKREKLRKKGKKTGKNGKKGGKTVKNGKKREKTEKNGKK